MAAKTNSVGHAKSSAWLRENIAFLKMRKANSGKSLEKFRLTVARTDYYDQLSLRLRGKPLKGAKIIEVGFGQRPLRLISMSSLGHDVRGVDLDQPFLTGSLAEFAAVAKKNGIRRLVKTAVRHFLFDRGERAALKAALAERGATLKIDPSIFIIGNAAEMDFPPGSIDFVYSEDVFEHIPPAEIVRLSRKMADWLAPDGVAVITPSVWTGLPGPHLTDWYPHVCDIHQPRQAEPWEHLRKRRFNADCYLNKLRLEDYRRILGADFEIVEEINEDAGLGRMHLTDAVRADLAEYSEEELLLNRYGFVLKHKATA